MSEVEKGDKGHPGERGASGDRGVMGERGPKGDHGQGGHQGRAGVEGQRGLRGRGAGVLFALTIIFVSGLVWKGQRDDCVRESNGNVPTRLVAAGAWNARLTDANVAQRHGDMVAAERFRRIAATYLTAWRESAPLDCGGLLPDTDAASDGKPKRIE